MSYFYNQNLKLHYAVMGTGEPLVLIGGITCDINHWQLIKDDLSKSFKLILLENRGIGQSEIATDDYTVADMAADVIKMLDKLNISEASILGHSMGGTVAQYIGAYYGNRVKNLIISHSFIKFRASSIMYCEHNYILQQINASPELQATSILPFVYSDEFISDKTNVSTFIESIKQNQSPQSLKSYKQQLSVISSVDSSLYISNIYARTLVIAGKSDKLAPLNDSKEITKKIANSILIELPDAHVPMWETPKDYANLILNFLLDSN